MLTFENPPKQEDEENGPFKKGQNKKFFFDEIPKLFSRGKVVELAKNHNMSERTMDNFLKSCLGKYLEQPDYGNYRKIN